VRRKKESDRKEEGWKGIKKVKRLNVFIAVNGNPSQSHTASRAI